MKLNEIKEWTPQKEDMGVKINFTPSEQNDLPKEEKFRVSLIENNELEGLWDLKFGELDNKDNNLKYKWEKDDPNRLTKILFLKKILENEIFPLFKSGRIKAIMFHPYEGDNLDNKRLFLFKNLFNKLNTKGEFDWEEDKDGNYFISSHPSSITEVRTLIRQIIREEMDAILKN